MSAYIHKNFSINKSIPQISPQLQKENDLKNPSILNKSTLHLD